MWRLTTQVERLMKDFPIGSQREIGIDEKIISVRLVDTENIRNLWLAEYDPITETTIWYLTWYDCEDKWLNFSVEELETRYLGTIDNIWEPMYRVDNEFTPTKFSDLPFNKESSK